MSDTASRESVVILYDSATGNIVHVHHVSSEPGTVHPDEATIEKQAAEQALESVSVRKTPMPSSPAFLHVDPASFGKRDITYKVDPKRRVLVEITR